MRYGRLISTVVAIAAFSAIVASQTPSGHALFEQALAKERVEGNLPEAIRLYERVVKEFASDRALAAKALVQVGLCYEKLGRDESVRAYERLLRDFADQADAVSHAHARLAVLKRPVAGAADAATMQGVRALPRLGFGEELLALSPDGAKAAFMNDRGNLAIYDLASGQVKVLTDLDRQAFAYHAVWSADSRRIAYTQIGTVYELRVATLEGKIDVILRNEANPGKDIVPAGWLPDGSALLVTLVRADNTHAIGLVPTAGGPFTPIRSSKWTTPYPDPPSLSPDGRLIAFSEGSPGMREIEVISRDGRTARRITDHPADDYRPLWSPGGGHLAFLSTRNGSVALWTVAVRDGQPAGDPVRAREGMQDVSLLSWTKLGLAYSGLDWTYDIYMMPVDRMTAEPAGSPRQLPYRRTGRNLAPAWSPDGKYFAFVSGSPAEQDRRSVVLVPSAGGEPREFPFLMSSYRPNRFGPGALRWFGNSGGLGFVSRDDRGELVLFRLTLATGEWKTFPLEPNRAPGFEWNSNGSGIYSVQRIGGDAWAIVAHDLDTGSERTVFKGDTDDRGFSGLQFSPDRRSLAFFSTGKQQRVTLVDSETGQGRVVAEESAAGLGLTPTWSPDGRAILITRTEKRTTELRLIPVGGGEVRRIPFGVELTRLLSAHPDPAVPTPMRTIAWSPDGSRLAFMLSSARQENWLLENPLAIPGRPDARARR